ncbi:MAG: ATP-binding protein [Candidatus Omnitrophica bacterium]|nr:ATP-binding protein [Candidatus Omnitrophota bacterium]
MSVQQNFFGRTAILELLKKRVLDLKEGYRQNVALFGNRYIGKTAILRQFLANLDEEIPVVYIDVENKDFRSFLDQFVGSLLCNYSRGRKLPLYEDVALLLESVQESIPHTVSVIRKIYKDYHAKKLSTSFHGLLALPEIFTNETGRVCVLVLDEFHRLEEATVPNAFAHLGKKIMTQKKCLYVVTSSHPQQAQKVLLEKLSLLFGNFEMIPVDPLDPQTSRQFIEETLQGIIIKEPLRDFLVDFTGGYPLYLHLICNELVSLSVLHGQDEVFIPVLARAVENTIFNRWGLISRHFELMVQELAAGKGNQIIPALLMSLANDKHKADDLCAELGFKKNQVAGKINRLKEEGVIFKNGNFYYFRDKLLKYWIKYIFQPRLKDMGGDPQQRRERFHQEFQSCVENFNVTSAKNLPLRIMELLYCFDNEAFDLNGRKYKLPVFREIVPWKISNEQGQSLNVIKALTNEDVWLIAVKGEIVSQAEVSALLEESRKNAPKPQRHLIISLKTLDENTRLKALQERCWIWNEDEINILLTLFNKPYISR